MYETCMYDVVRCVLYILLDSCRSKSRKMYLNLAEENRNHYEYTQNITMIHCIVYICIDTLNIKTDIRCCKYLPKH